MFTSRLIRLALMGSGWLAVTVLAMAAESSESLEEVKARLAAETQRAYEACPYSFLSKDCFARFVRDPQARPGEHETAVGADWRILLPASASSLTAIMAEELSGFLSQRMALEIPVDRLVEEEVPAGRTRAVILLDRGGGDPAVPESFTIAVRPEAIVVQGRDEAGTRDGVARLVEIMGLRRAPIVPVGQQVYRPRVSVRLGVVPWLGSFRDLVFLGFNAVLLNTYFEGEENLFALSISEAIPELAGRRRPAVRQRLIEQAREARRYGLKVFAQINTRKKFAADDPVFRAHPEIRGALTWSADGEYVLCSGHPLVQRYLTETIEDLFRDAQLDGVMLIIGGESFYHCFMRSYGTAKGHTNCPRCEPVGAEQAVADLCNLIVAAARKVNPQAEGVAWPYSAEHVWSADRYQIGLIEKLRPGAAILTEIEKDEVATKPEGVQKHIADYSIDLIGPGQRALRQVAACRAAGLSIYIKSEPELGFEAPRLPYIPCLDRWADRAAALISCEPTGAWVFPYFRPFFAGSSGEVFRFFWWDPPPDRENVLASLARRIAGEWAGPHLRRAWKHVSEAIEWSPVIPPYYTGPYYIGPAHPMCVSPSADMPEVFYGRFLFMGEHRDEEGLRLRPVYTTSPFGDVEVFGRFYRRMETSLRRAVEELDAAEADVPSDLRLLFEAECSPIRWFYHTARTHANFYESCRIRDAVQRFAGSPERTAGEREAHRRLLCRWREVLLDERAHLEAALRLVETDMRLDCYYGFDHAFPHAADMIRAKIGLLEAEMGEILPQIARQCDLNMD